MLSFRELDRFLLDLRLHMTITLLARVQIFTLILLFYSNDKSFNRGPLNRTQSIERPGECTDDSVSHTISPVKSVSVQRTELMSF